MPAETLTPERILCAAEDVLRRHGPAKTNVVDVARALGVSHGSVYRHFSSKAALRDAVTERWLSGISTPLEAIARETGDAEDRARRWLDLLVHTKRSRAFEDPELFATYVELTADSREVVMEHVAHLVGQLDRIVSDGIEQGVFDVDDPAQAARAAFDATARFHNPVHAATWADPMIDRDYEAVRELVLRGMRRRPR